MDRFSALKAFTRVVEAGSFTRAADSLDMPNATLSKTIKQLEAHLGVSLLQRTTRRITVTPEGREYYEKARCLLEDLEEIDASFNTAHNKPKGHLRIAIGGSTACDVLIPLLADFMTAWPDIRIDLQVADKPADLISGNIDCAIRGGPMDDSTLIARKIGEATLVTCATLAIFSAAARPPRRMNSIMATSSSAICRRPAAERFRFALRVTASVPSSRQSPISASMRATRILPPARRA
jgi:DNA-binding transcriptional LysR family regulator